MYDDLMMEYLCLFGHAKRVPLSVSPRAFITPDRLGTSTRLGR